LLKRRLFLGGIWSSCWFGEGGGDRKRNSNWYKASAANIRAAFFGLEEHAVFTNA